MILSLHLSLSPPLSLYLVHSLSLAFSCFLYFVFFISHFTILQDAYLKKEGKNLSLFHHILSLSHYILSLAGFLPHSSTQL